MSNRATSASLSTTDLNWAVGAHVASVFTMPILVGATGPVGPLAVLLFKGRTSDFIRRHAVDSLNFNITVLLAIAVAWLISAVGAGLPSLVLFVAVAIAWFAFTIRAALRAKRGEYAQYPLTLRLVK